MKEVGSYTQVAPAARQSALVRFVSRISENPEASVHLTNWGLKLEPEPMQLQSRILEPERLYFGKNYVETVNAKADWGRAATSKQERDSPI
jgi:hypothetical protein